MPVIEEIERLKKEKNAVILAHSYVTPDIIYSVADYSGDSYELSKNALEAEGELIVFAAVRFMGETAKILSPHKEVLIPGTDPACSLADSITGEDVRALKAKYPDHAFICYINTTAEVKAECDVSVTSSNVYRIIENHPSDRIFFLPDKLMGQNVIDEMARRGVKKEIRLWDGTCYVHEEFEPGMIDEFRAAHPDIYVNGSPGVQTRGHPEGRLRRIHQPDVQEDSRTRHREGHDADRVRTHQPNRGGETGEKLPGSLPDVQIHEVQHPGRDSPGA